MPLVFKILEAIFFGLIPKHDATPEEQLMWRQLVAGLLVISLAMSFGNSAYSFGYLGFTGFASQSSIDALTKTNLEEQISRVTIRWCEARKMRNLPAFELAGKQLRALTEQYRTLTKATFAPTCTELLIDG